MGLLLDVNLGLTLEATDVTFCCCLLFATVVVCFFICFVHNYYISITQQSI